MKIIYRGEPPKSPPPIRATCSNCRSILEFEREEAETVEHVFATIYRTICPVCGVKFGVPR